MPSNLLCYPKKITSNTVVSELLDICKIYFGLAGYLGSIRNRNGESLGQTRLYFFAIRFIMPVDDPRLLKTKVHKNKIHFLYG